MLSWAHNTRIFLHVPATDLRKSFEGLGGLVPGGFTLRAHELVLYGQCSTCAKDSEHAA